MQLRRFSTVFALYLRPVAINPTAKHEEEEYATTSEAKALAALADRPLGSFGIIKGDYHPRPVFSRGN